MANSNARAAFEHRILARAYREMAESWRSILQDPARADACVLEAQHHEREARAIERAARLSPATTPVP